jgi:DNA transformation protein and related proteins
MKENDLLEQINIGKDTAAKLQRVGIDTFQKLKSTGSKQAFLMLQTLDPGACINLLYALEGAIEGIKDTKLSATKKIELKEFFAQVKRKA